MKREEKVQVIKNLIEKFSTFKFFYIVDSTDLTVEHINKFRKICIKNNVIYKVAKNTLIKKALEQSIKYVPYQTSFFNILKGFSGILFSRESGNIPGEILKYFLNFKKIKLPIFKAAYINGDFFIGIENLDKLIKLKSKEEVLVDIIKLIKFSIINVVHMTLSGKKCLLNIVENLKKNYP